MPLLDCVLDTVDISQADPESHASTVIRIACHALEHAAGSIALAVLSVDIVWNLGNSCYPYRYRLVDVREASLLTTHCVEFLRGVAQRTDVHANDLGGEFVRLIMCALNWIGWEVLSRALEHGEGLSQASLQFLIQHAIECIKRIEPGSSRVGRDWDFLQRLAWHGPLSLVDFMMSCSVVEVTCETAWRLRNVENNVIEGKQCPHVFVGGAICFLEDLHVRLGGRLVMDQVQQFEDLTRFLQRLHHQDAFQFWYPFQKQKVATFLDLLFSA